MLIADDKSWSSCSGTAYIIPVSRLLSRQILSWVGFNRSRFRSGSRFLRLGHVALEKVKLRGEQTAHGILALHLRFRRFLRRLLSQTLFLEKALSRQQVEDRILLF